MQGGNQLETKENIRKDYIRKHWIPFGNLTVSGSYPPPNSKGGLPAPEAKACAQEGGVEGELTQLLAGWKAREAKQRPDIQVDSVPSQSREEPDQEASLKKEAESGSNP